MQERPRFRNDLVAQPVTDGGQRFVDVTDPDSGSTFRFYEVEYAVACAMDGKRDVASLAAWSQAELGLTPSTAEITTVVGTLGDLGYLDNAGGGSVGDVELGMPGKSPIAETDSPTIPASGMDLELGAAGASDDDAFDTEADTQIAPVTRLMPDNDDVSVDLSQHLSIDTDDVKEAVRQSRVMSAVEAPADEPAPKEEPKKEAKKPVARKPVSKSSLSASVAEEAAKEDVGSKPVVEIPSKAPAVAAAAAELADAKKAAGDKAKSGGGSTTILLLILLLAILGGGGYFVYTNYFAGDASSSVDPAENKAAVAAVNVAAKKKL